MIERITSALTALVKPIAATESEQVKTGKKEESPAFEQFKPDEPGEKGKKDASSNSPDPNLPPSGPEATERKPTSKGFSTESFMRVKSGFENCKNKIVRWMGTRSYRKSAETSKKKKKIRKGIICDEKIE